MIEQANSSRRVIVGFDLRTIPLRGLSPPLSSSRTQFQATLDNEVWPSLINDDDANSVRQFGRTNPLNLLGLPDFWNADKSIRKNAIPVAFDLATDFLLDIGREDHVTQISLHALMALSGWKLLGFDVVDKYVSYSAIWSPHFSSGAYHPPLLECFEELNGYGLFLSHDSAQRAATRTGDVEELRSHEPFTPCGVWVKCM